MMLLFQTSSPRIELQQVEPLYFLFIESWNKSTEIKTIVLHMTNPISYEAGVTYSNISRNEP